MIPTLLWRCPLCETNDALIHLPRRLRADLVRCTYCSAQWRVRRVLGDDYYLRLVKGTEESVEKRPRRSCLDLRGLELPLREWYEMMKRGKRPRRPCLDLRGLELPLREWYEMMKRSVSLVAVEDPPVSLQSRELAYLVSGPVDLTAEANDPLFFSAVGKFGDVVLEKSKVEGVVVGRGTLILTNRRLVWQGEERACSFPLESVSSAHTLLDYGVAFMVGMRLYIACFLEESVLKWITHLALVARELEAETGHRIVTSHF